MLLQKLPDAPSLAACAACLANKDMHAVNDHTYGNRQHHQRLVSRQLSCGEGQACHPAVMCGTAVNTPPNCCNTPNARQRLAESALPGADQQQHNIYAASWLHMIQQVLIHAHLHRNRHLLCSLAQLPAVGHHTLVKSHRREPVTPTVTGIPTLLQLYCRGDRPSADSTLGQETAEEPATHTVGPSHVTAHPPQRLTPAQPTHQVTLANDAATGASCVTSHMLGYSLVALGSANQVPCCKHTSYEISKAPSCRVSLEEHTQAHTSCNRLAVITTPACPLHPC